MDIQRRNLMKGMLTGGTLAALGIPGISPVTFASAAVSKGRSFGLLLGDTRADDAFAKGAFAAYADKGRGELPTVTLRGGLLIDPGRVDALLEHSRGMRWIAIMDDANAAVFTELLRNARIRLLALGSHAFSGGEASPARGDASLLRHVWTIASHAYSAGGILASRLVDQQSSFSITENFLGESPANDAMGVWSAPSFSSYQSPGPNSIHLHCSGLSPSEGCKLLGWDIGGEWAAVSPEPHKAIKGEAGREGPIPRQQAGDWMESTGYAVTAAAIDLDANGDVSAESCSGRAFVHRSSSHRGAGALFPVERFTSFVVEI